MPEIAGVLAHVTHKTTLFRSVGDWFVVVRKSKVRCPHKKSQRGVFAGWPLYHFDAPILD